MELCRERESFLIPLTHESINDMPVCDFDAPNAYLQAPFSKKHCVVCDLEFGLDNLENMKAQFVLFIVANLLEMYVVVMLSVF